MEIDHPPVKNTQTHLAEHVSQEFRWPSLDLRDINKEAVCVPERIRLLESDKSGLKVLFCFFFKAGNTSNVLRDKY